jgi:hypothetical protein
MSLKHRYLPWHPAITKNSLPTLAEEWNLLAQGLIPLAGVGT